MKKKIKKTIIAVDFDGTLCEDKYPKIGKPKLDTILYLKTLKQHCNCILILWTCRKDTSLKRAINWCKKYDLTFDYVNENTKENIKKYGNIDTRKVYAHYYIDDKAKQDFEVFYEITKNMRF